MRENNAKCCDWIGKILTAVLIIIVATVIIHSIEDEVKETFSKRRFVFPDDELLHNDE